MRICHLSKYYPPAPGGIETHVATLARGQAAMGAEVRIVCVNHDGTSRRRSVVEDQDGPVVVRRLQPWASISRWDVCPNLRGELQRVTNGDFDVVHLHVPNPTMLLGLNRVAMRSPLVITYHSDVVRQKMLYQLMRPFERRVFNRTHRILATSANYCRGSHVLQHYQDRVEVCPFGVATDRYVHPSPAAERFREQLVKEHGDPLWICVGRLVYYKGFEIALQALVDVPGKLAIVGRGPLESELRAKAETLGVADRVVWLPRLSDDELVGAFHAATALWFPSVARSEAFGLVQVEAMASGRPVINTDIAGSGVPWVSPHERTGLTVPVGDATAFAAASRRLLEEPGLADALGEAGRGRAVSRFDEQAMIRRTLEVYGELTSPAPVLASA